jgi:hypothetical protein
VEFQQGPPLDRFLVSRLLLGALSEHEQRQLLVRLLRADAATRREIAPFLEPFVVEDGERLDRFEEALASGVDAEVARKSLLDRDSEAELEELIRAFTFQDLFQLGEASRRLFSWGMAELLLRRSQKAEIDMPTRRTSFFLATAVVDGLEILGAAGVAPPHPRAIADLRRRLKGSGAVLRPGSP